MSQGVIHIAVVKQNTLLLDTLLETAPNVPALVHTPTMLSYTLVHPRGCTLSCTGFPCMPPCFL